MQQHANFTIAHKLWDAIAMADAAALRELLSEKSTWRMPGGSALAGSYVGADAILEFMARVGELADDLQSDLIDIYVSEEGAVLRYGVHAVRGSERLDTEHLFPIRIEDGRITGGVFAPIDQLAYDRFFSPGPSAS
jgi:ketosteroid isomerase-like protein